MAPAADRARRERERWLRPPDRARREQRERWLRPPDWARGAIRGSGRPTRLAGGDWWRVTAPGRKHCRPSRPMAEQLDTSFRQTARRAAAPPSSAVVPPSFTGAVRRARQDAPELHSGRCQLRLTDNVRQCKLTPMNEATELADATASRDPAVGLAAVASLRRLLESLEALQVGNARGAGLELAADRGRARRVEAGGPQEARRAATAREAMMFERFTKEARGVVTAAYEEASALHDEQVRPAHLVLAASRTPGGVAGQALRRLDLGPEGLREAIAATPGARRRMDPDALASLGIDLEQVRRRVEAAFGEGALDRGAGARARPQGRPRPVLPLGEEGTGALPARGARARRQAHRRRAPRAGRAARRRPGAGGGAAPARPLAPGGAGRGPCGARGAARGGGLTARPRVAGTGRRAERPPARSPAGRRGDVRGGREPMWRRDIARSACRPRGTRVRCASSRPGWC